MKAIDNKDVNWESLDHCYLLVQQHTQAKWPRSREPYSLCVLHNYPVIIKHFQFSDFYVLLLLVSGKRELGGGGSWIIASFTLSIIQTSILLQIVSDKYEKLKNTHCSPVISAAAPVFIFLEWWRAVVACGRGSQSLASAVCLVTAAASDWYSTIATGKQGTSRVFALERLGFLTDE